MVGLRWAVLGCCAGVSLLLTACGAPGQPPAVSSASGATAGSQSPTSSSPTSTPVASAGGTPTPAPPSTPAAGASGACFPAGLAFSLEARPQDSGAGNFYWNLLVTNTSDSACQVEGYPTIVLLDASGGALGAPSGRDTTPGAGPVEVPLAPGASAYSLLHLTQAGAHGCPLAPVAEVAVTLPDGGATQRTATPHLIQGCADSTTEIVHAGALGTSPVSY